MVTERIKILITAFRLFFKGAETELLRLLLDLLLNSHPPTALPVLKISKLTNRNINEFKALEKEYSILLEHLYPRR